jgi:hypothetical protein
MMLKWNREKEKFIFQVVSVTTAGPGFRKTPTFP